MKKKNIKERIKKLIKKQVTEMHRPWHTPGYEDKFPKHPDKPKDTSPGMSSMTVGKWKVLAVNYNPNTSGTNPIDYAGWHSCPPKKAVGDPQKQKLKKR